MFSSFGYFTGWGGLIVVIKKFYIHLPLPTECLCAQFESCCDLILYINNAKHDSPAKGKLMAQLCGQLITCRSISLRGSWKTNIKMYPLSEIPAYGVLF